MTDARQRRPVWRGFEPSRQADELTGLPGLNLPQIVSEPPIPIQLGVIPESGMVGNVPTTLECEEMLRETGLRATRPRVAVLNAVHEHPHADTGLIIGAVRDDLGDVSPQAVYDGLRALSDAGLVRHIQPPGSVARYESRVGDNHHHIVCRTCGAIADVDCAVGEAPCMSVSDDHGFTIDETEVVHRGLCPECAESNPSDQTAVPRKDPLV